MTSLKVCMETGASLRQLQWWDEHKIVRPSSNGHSRKYSEEDVRRVRLVLELRKKGFKLRSIQRILPKLVKVPRGEYAVVSDNLVLRFKTAAHVLQFASMARGSIHLIEGTL